MRSNKTLFNKFALIIFSMLITGCATLTQPATSTKTSPHKANNVQIKSTYERPTEEIQNQDIEYGHDTLFDRRYYTLIDGKNVGFFGNQTSQSTLDKLIDDPNINVAKIFVPEHGLNGNHGAGEHFDDTQYRGIPVIAVYGSGEERRIAPKQLKDLDNLIFEIQDLDMRFYTYKSSLYLAMDSCADVGKPLIVLDRPNLNGDSIEGPILEPEYQSFIGVGQLPAKTGLTIGEFALFALNEAKYMDGDRYHRQKPEDRYSNVKDLELIVVPMKHYDPSKPIQEQVNPEKWIPTSPMITTVKSGQSYGTGILDGHVIDVVTYNWKEHGYNAFNYIQIPKVHTEKQMETFINEAKSNYSFPGVNLEIITNPDTNQTNIIHFDIQDFQKFNATESSFALMYTYNKTLGKNSRNNNREDAWIYKVHGTDKLLKLINNPQEHSFREVLYRIREGLQEYKTAIKPYKLYQ